MLLFTFKLNRYPKDFTAVGSYISPLENWEIFNDGKGSEFYIPEPTLAQVKSKMDFENQEKIVALCPAAAWDKKMWPEEHWIELIKKLMSETNLNIIILAGPTDTFCKKLVIDPNRVKSFQGKLTLIESAAAVKLCQKMVSADTGLMHIAEALGKNVVCLTGPTPFGTPFRKTSIELKTQLWCQPCSKDGSGICYNFTYKKCMKLVNVEEVFEALKQIE